MEGALDELELGRAEAEEAAVEEEAAALTFLGKAEGAADFCAEADFCALANTEEETMPCMLETAASRPEGRVMLL